MGKEYRRLPDAEFEIMKIIWEAGVPVTSADVMEHIRPKNKWANTTVLNFLSRLIDKGFLSIHKQGRLNVYTAQADEQRYLNQQGADFLIRFYQGSITNMLSSLYDAKAIDDDDLVELSEFIASKVSDPSDSLQTPHGESKWQQWYRRHFRV